MAEGSFEIRLLRAHYATSLKEVEQHEVSSLAQLLFFKENYEPNPNFVSDSADSDYSNPTKLVCRSSDAVV